MKKRLILLATLTMSMGTQMFAMESTGGSESSSKSEMTLILDTLAKQTAPYTTTQRDLIEDIRTFVERHLDMQKVNFLKVLSLYTINEQSWDKLIPNPKITPCYIDHPKDDSILQQAQKALMKENLDPKSSEISY